VHSFTRETYDTADRRDVAGRRTAVQPLQAVSLKKFQARGAGVPAHPRRAAGRVRKGRLLPYAPRPEN